VNDVRTGVSCQRAARAPRVSQRPEANARHIMPEGTLVPPTDKKLWSSARRSLPLPDVLRRRTDYKSFNINCMQGDAST